MTHALTPVIQDIDRSNSDDPRREPAGPDGRPFEVVYSERMTKCLAELYPSASDALQIAARGQHICRWQIPRSQYPLGRDGYNAWRGACREHHAALVVAIMERHGYAAEICRHVASIIKKQHLKSDPESQALENVVGVVFVRHYLDDFVQKNSDYSAEKLLAILRKTLRKMDDTGIIALTQSTLPQHLTEAIHAALEPTGSPS